MRTTSSSACSGSFSVDEIEIYLTFFTIIISCAEKQLIDKNFSLRRKKKEKNLPKISLNHNDEWKK